MMLLFTVNNQRIVLSEHQSTINPNMPLRNLMYIAREYERIVPVRKRYQKNLIELPTPVFYTFYNGTEDYPTEQELLLSSAFTDKTDPALELKVKIININPDKKHDLLDKCAILKEYSEFVEITRKCQKNKASLADAIQQCIKRGILADYLRRKSSEVVNMLMAEYDYEMDIAVQREEAAQEAAQKGLQRGEFKKLINQIIKKLKKGYTIVQIADDLEETGENIQPLVDIALKYAPEYDENKILDEVLKIKEII